MYVGWLYKSVPNRWQEDVHHIWMEPETGQWDGAVSGCGLSKLDTDIKYEGEFRLARWDDREKFKFKRCKRCDAWRKKMGEEALVAEALGGKHDPGPPSLFEDLRRTRDVIRAGGATRRGATMRTR